MKLLPKILLSKVPLKVKIESFFHLTCFTMHLYMMALVTLLLPAMYLRPDSAHIDTIWRNVMDVGVFTLATLSASVFYVASQFELFRDWRTAVKFLPMLMALGVGMCVSNTKAIIEAFIGKKSEFVRTPKYGDRRNLSEEDVALSHSRTKRSLLPYVEFLFGIYMSICAVLSIVDLRALVTAPFLVIFAFGFFYVSILSFIASRATTRAADRATEVAERVGA